MGQCISRRDSKNRTASDRPEVSQWYSEEDIDVLKQNVELWDILEIELSNDPPLYEGVLVVGQSGNDLQLAQLVNNTDTAVNELHTVLIEEVIVNRKVRINNEIFGLEKFESEEDKDDIIQRFILSVMAHFLHNSIMPFISYVAEEIRSLPNEQEDLELTEVEPVDESSVKTLISSILTILIELAGHDLEDRAEDNEGKVSSWFNRNNIKNLESELCVGDRLEFKRRCFYSHWGICLGKLGDVLLVVHFSTAGSGKQYLMNESFGLQSSAKDVPVYRIDSIEKPLGHHRVRINNRLDNKYSSLAPDDILSHIIHRIGTQSFQESPTYSVLRNNCEHFVNELRHREHLSEQVPQIVDQEIPI